MTSEVNKMKILKAARIVKQKPELLQQHKLPIKLDKNSKKSMKSIKECETLIKKMETSLYGSKRRSL
jgi:hypothetical protein